MAEIVVVGAGVGGLSAAVRLRALGHRVTVYEQASTVGGKLGLFERDGFRFDTGPSLLTLPELFFETLMASGMSEDAARGSVDLVRLDPIATYRFGDGTWWDHPAGDADLFAAAEGLSPGSGRELQRFLARAANMWQASKGPFLESPLDGATTLLRQAVRLRDLRTISPTRTLRQLSTSRVHDQRLIDFIDRYATYSGSDPRRSPAALASILWVERSGGAWYVRGGLRRLAEVLVHRCQEIGVTVTCDADVVEVMTEANRAVGVRLADGRVHRADVVVANADATHLYESLIPGPEAESSRRGVRRAQPSLSGFVVCLAVDRKTATADVALRELGHHTVLFPTNYEAEFDDLFATQPRIVGDPTIYLSIPKDPTVAPEGCEAWFLLVNAPRHDQLGQTGVDWGRSGRAEDEADRLLAILATRGVDVRPSVRFREIRTPADLEHRTRSVGGSIYGTSSNGMRAAFLRPANRSRISRLFLVGGSSHPGGGLPLVQMSATIVADIIGPA